MYDIIPLDAEYLIKLDSHRAKARVDRPGRNPGRPWPAHVSSSTITYLLLS